MQKRLTRLSFLFFTLSIWLASARQVLAQADPQAVAPGTDQSLFGLLQQGGWAMWPLGLCCLLTLYLAIYAWRETTRGKFIPDPSLPQLNAQLRERQLDEASQTLQGGRTVLCRALAIALTKARPEWPDANREKVEGLLGEALEAEENHVGQWVNYLNVIAAVAPMIGLLGTVSGMISAFQTISAGGMGRPELLAGDIGEALITTATGLVIGIPAMILYFIMRNRLSSVMIQTVQTASALVDEMVGDQQPPGSDPQAEWVTHLN